MPITHTVIQHAITQAQGPQGCNRHTFWTRAPATHPRPSTALRNTHGRCARPRLPRAPIALHAARQAPLLAARPRPESARTHPPAALPPARPNAQVDDPVSAFSLHAGAGAYGLLFVGFLAKEEYITEVYNVPPGGSRMGLLYGGHGQLLLCQFIAVLSIGAWSAANMSTLFLILKVRWGLARSLARLLRKDLGPHMGVVLYQ